MPALPAIGEYEQHVDLSEPFRKITPEMRPGNLGATMENVGNQWASAVDAKNRADGSVYAANQMADLRTRTAAHLVNAKQNAAEDGNGFTQTVLDQYDKDAGTLLDAAKNNPYATKSLSAGLTQFRSQVADHAINWESQAGVQYRGNSLLKNIDSLAPVVEADPSQWQSAGNEQMHAIENSNLPPEQRILLGRKLDETLSVAAANGLARQNPRSVIEGLNDPTKAHPAIAGLTDAQRESLRARANEHLSDNVYTALSSGDTRGAQIALSKNEDILDPRTAVNLQHTILAQNQSDIVRNDKLQRDSSDALLKNAILMQKNGQLTPQFIEQHHDTWEPAAYEYAYKLLAGKESQTDPHVYAPLLQQALSGQDVSQKAQDALYAGQLTLSDYKAIADKSEAPRKGYVARGADFISEALKPSPMVQDPAGQRSHANALDDWRQWTEDHPNATENEARTTYRNIADHYQVITADKATVFMPVPLQLVGSRLAPDIPQTWAATKKAHDSGAMGDAEYQRQALLITQWMNATAKKATAKATQ